MSNAAKQYFGKYSATVINNVDPMGEGRIQVLVPAVNVTPLATWAKPCLPVAGIQSGFFAIPVPTSKVWVEFEAGNIDNPIWVGGFWGSSAEIPATLRAPAPIPPNPPAPPAAPFAPLYTAPGTPLPGGMAMVTPLQNGLYIEDGPAGGILLRSTTGASILVNDTGIYIDNGKGASITLVGPMINFNKGALTIIS